MGIPVPGWVLKIVSKVLTIFHIDGVIVLSGQASIDAATVTALTNAVQSAIRGYNFAT